MIVHYIVEEYIFFFFVYKLLVQKKYKTNGRQKVKMSKKDEYVRFKNYEKKIKSPFMIYVYFQRILVPEDIGKQNSEKSIRRNIKNMLLILMAIN